MNNLLTIRKPLVLAGVMVIFSLSLGISLLMLNNQSYSELTEKFITMEGLVFTEDQTNAEPFLVNQVIEHDRYYILNSTKDILFANGGGKVLGKLNDPNCTKWGNIVVIGNSLYYPCLKAGSQKYNDEGFSVGGAFLLKKVDLLAGTISEFMDMEQVENIPGYNSFDEFDSVAYKGRIWFMSGDNVAAINVQDKTIEMIDVQQFAEPTTPDSEKKRSAPTYISDLLTDGETQMWIRWGLGEQRIARYVESLPNFVIACDFSLIPGYSDKTTCDEIYRIWLSDEGRLTANISIDFPYRRVPEVAWEEIELGDDNKWRLLPEASKHERGQIKQAETGQSETVIRYTTKAGDKIEFRLPMYTVKRQPDLLPAESDVYVYYIGIVGRTKGLDLLNDLPANSVFVDNFFNDRKYFIPVLYKEGEGLNIKQKIELALEALMGEELFSKFSSEGYGTYWADEENIESFGVSEQDGRFIIDLEGYITLVGDSDGRYIRSQIINTIKLYTTNFEIRLNGSEKNFYRVGDMSGG